jgi:DMSO reductase family type II enzyme heme b subunit
MKHLTGTPPALQPIWLGRVVVVAVTSLVLGLWLSWPAGEVQADGSARPAGQSGRGQQIYEERCAACHGSNGDGLGPGADHLFVKPRDFTRDEYKIKSTVGDEFPSRDDLIQVIAEGMPGSSMPAWNGILTRDEMGAVADYIQTFGRFFAQEGYGTNLIKLPARPDASPESIARGAELYVGDIECAKCHGAAGRGDGPSALELTDNAGNVIYPADLTQPWTFRGGMEPQDVYLRLRTGLTGSPMPAFADALSEEETWDLVNFIFSLAPEEPVEPAVLLVSHFVNGALPDAVDDPAWTELDAAYYPLTPQLMRAPREFQTPVNAVRVKSLYNASEVAFHLAWNDRTETAGPEADGVAIQFPQELSDGVERPYFVFGDTSRPVYQWYWSAAAVNQVTERNGQGINALEPQAEERWQTIGSARYQDGQWQVVLRRALRTSDEPDLALETDRFMPLSFMVWDGGAHELQGTMGMTSWSVVFLESPKPLTQFLWIPAVMVIVFVIELLIIWLVRRFAGAAPQG